MSTRSSVRFALGLATGERSGRSASCVPPRHAIAQGLGPRREAGTAGAERDRLAGGRPQCPVSVDSPFGLAAFALACGAPRFCFREQRAHTGPWRGLGRLTSPLWWRTCHQLSIMCCMWPGANACCPRRRQHFRDGSRGHCPAFSPLVRPNRDWCGASDFQDLRAQRVVAQGPHSSGFSYLGGDRWGHQEGYCREEPSRMAILSTIVIGRDFELPGSVIPAGACASCVPLS